VAAIDVVAAAEAVEAASVTSVVGRFAPATREAKPADSLTPVTTSSAPSRYEVVEAVEEEVEAVAIVVDDRPAVAGSDSCHKVPAENRCRLTHERIYDINVRVYTHIIYARTHNIGNNSM